MIITIDGPAGTGKSTIAKALAKELGFTYFDTGALYRAITWASLQYGIAVDNETALQKLLQEHPLTIRAKSAGKHYFLGTVDITQEIRSPRVTSEVSRVSAYSAVRTALVAMQRACAQQEKDSVFEGRDMGTVVFPSADLKIFLTASPAVRAQRRHRELLQSGLDLSLEQVLEDIERRDHLDSSRDLSPLRPADDAHIVDTSTLSINEVVTTITRLLP